MSRVTERRQASKQEEGGANWMDTYGDLVTLLLTFFVLLFSFSTIDAQKWKTLVGALSGSTAVAIPVLNPEMAMEAPINTILTTTVYDTEEVVEDEPPIIDDIKDDNGNVQLEYERFLQLYTKVGQYIDEHQLSAEVIVDYEAYRIIIRFADSVFFESGKADILPESEETLNHIAHILSDNQDLIEMINIQGHTDNVPISTSLYPSNWELSVSRAVNTLRYLLATDLIDSEKISAVGYSEFHPVKTNETVEGRAANRRVDFVIQGYKSS
ncbi:MAG: OmpA family protein [Clostridiales bacterium]|nr:OmpA family protein [Clostridiales bacterium]